MQTYPFPTISGYCLVETLYESPRTILYRAVREADQRPVVLKSLKREYPSLRELLHLKNQYGIAKHLEGDRFVQIYGLERYRNGYVLVMADDGSISLSQYAAAQPLDLEIFFAIALQMTEVLESLYQHHIIHRDIKPDNILIHPVTRHIKLIDFSIASLLPRESQEMPIPQTLESSLAYLAPEQTGRMNRGIDYRADFYSLGVTFYELLTGQIPFNFEDPMEMVHAHLARQPIPIHQLRPAVPEGLSAVVTRLLAKNAEDRYQSATGLRHDLLHCQQVYQQSGLVPLFELGERDRSDRFTIPEKLYGRDAEVKTLLSAFERVSLGTTEVMLVTGASGIGKTAVIHEIHKPILRQRGYFIQGKFDQFQHNIPFYALVQAFEDLMEQLLSESDAQIEQWKREILQALGDSAQVIIDVLPELGVILGPQPPVPPLTGDAAQTRFNRLLQKFIQLFATPDHPLVMFIDDLQWADNPSLQLLQTLLGKAETPYLLVIGAYRDREVGESHPLREAIAQIEKAGTMLHRLHLEPLQPADLNQMIADALLCSAETAGPLTQVMYQQTRGNPFFSTQLLRALAEDGLVRFSPEMGGWQYDIAAIHNLMMSDDVVEFVSTQLQRLPAATQKVLQLAACIGNQFDLATLAIVHEKTPRDTATDLWRAIQEGLIVPRNENYKVFQPLPQGGLPDWEDSAIAYKFLHDRVQQAAYSLILADECCLTHLKIGQQLLRNTPPQQFEERIFEIVNQLNMGLELLTEPSEREQLAQLNLTASRKAKGATAYEPADRYLQAALMLLPPTAWQEHYALMLDVYLEAIEAAYLMTDFGRAEQLVEQARQGVTDPLDQVKITAKQLLILIAQNQLSTVLAIARPALADLDVTLPDPDTAPQDLVAQLHQEMRDRGLTAIEDLADLPAMSEPAKQEAMRILTILFAPVLIGYPHLMPLLAAKMVELCIRHGNSPLAAFAYVFYGWLLCGVLGDIESGYRFGQLGVSILEHFAVSEINCKVEEVFAGFVKHWKDPLETTLEALRKSFQSALEVGDLEYAGYSGTIYCHNLFFVGYPLAAVTQEQAKYISFMRQNKQAFLILHTGIIHQLALQLTDPAAPRDRLMGKGFDVQKHLPMLQESQTVMSLFSVYSCQAILNYLFGNYDRAQDYSQQAEPYVVAVGGMNLSAEYYFYRGLILLAGYLALAPGDRPAALAAIAVCQQKVQGWAEHAPTNYQAKADLLQAERYRVEAQPWQAAEWYDRAIQRAQGAGYIHEEAIACERAAEFYLACGREKLAQVYLIDAYYAYERWGAAAKVADLEARYGQWLSPILQSPPGSLLASGLEALPEQNSRSTTADSLDLLSVIKAAQTLSSEIRLDSLLTALIEVVLENAGAEKCVLMLPHAEEWRIEGIAIAPQTGQKSITVLQSVPVSQSDQVPVSLVNYVRRTQEEMVLENAAHRLTWADDAYIARRKPQSVACLPILHRGQIAGILYLENNQCAGAFTSDRIQFINLLSAQAAISLQNARFYQQSQDYAQKLEDSIRELQAMQIQLVQSEKMSALGGLVAGVAHEINNPVGFIAGNLTPARNYVDDLLGLIDLYQETFPEPGPDILEEIEAMDLNYIKEDLPKLLASMREGVNRIRSISMSLRTFSRADSDRQTPFQLHDGLESTILILKHRLKANGTRPAVEIVREYGDLPPIRCFPGQINQVFMNLLANAIDALEESNRDRTFEDLQKNPNRITIRTEIHSPQVVIRIQDNGPGISEEIRDRIFDHLFTTKAVGQGTGLGLAIAHQIVVDKHQGTLEASSLAGGGAEFTITLPVQGVV